jgi:small subunit ribosomal protein S3Ae
LSRRRRVRDKWREKKWYTVVAPQYFGGVELGTIPSEDPNRLLGRIVDSTLYDITEDFSHQNQKMYFQIIEVDNKTAKTVLKKHEYSRDYLRSLVRRRTTRVDAIIDITTKDDYRLRVAICAFSLTRIKTSHEKTIRDIMRRVIREKAETLTFDQFVQEVVLGKIASDIYNQAKKIAPLRHVGVRKSKLVSSPLITS